MWMSACACVRACLRVCEWVRALHACMRACVRVDAICMETRCSLLHAHRGTWLWQDSTLARFSKYAQCYRCILPLYTIIYFQEYSTKQNKQHKLLLTIVDLLSYPFYRFFKCTKCFAASCTPVKCCFFTPISIDTHQPLFADSCRVGGQMVPYLSVARLLTRMLLKQQLLASSTSDKQRSLASYLLVCLLLSLDLMHT